MPTSLRGQFAVNNNQYQQLLAQLQQYDDVEIFLISTCNRTEICFLGVHKTKVIEAFCKVTEVDEVVLQAYAYNLNGAEAIKHLFRVASGLDSQILGDYEIVGQIKRAFQFAQQKGTIKVVMERIFQHVLQAARSVRSQTQISSGSVSVAFAAAQFAYQNNAIANPKVIIIGAGEIARNVAINIRTIMPSAQLSITNRTYEKAVQLAEEVDATAINLEIGINGISKFDVIVSAANASHYLINKDSLLHTKDNYVLIDLSIPENINPDVQKLKQVTYANVDIISKIGDATLKTRALEIPKVEKIIIQHFDELIDWLKMRKMVPMIKEVKEKLNSLDEFVAPDVTIEKKPVIQTVINSMTQKLKDKATRKPGCNYIETYVAYFDKMKQS